MSLNGGYAMIKYNSTQEELQIAYRSKKPALFYDENQRAHWAVIEETATQSVDEETQEPITLYEYSYRLLDEESGGSEVHLYRHTLSFGNGKFIVVFDIFSSTPISEDDLRTTYASSPTPFSVFDTFSGYFLSPMAFTAAEFGTYFNCVKIMEDGSGASFVAEQAQLSQDTVTQIS